MGRLLVQAKEALPHGDFGPMVEEDLPFGPRKARMLMAIARDERLRNRKRFSDLPPAWSTLYKLTTLDEEEWEAVEPHLSPELTRSEIPALLSGDDDSGDPSAKLARLDVTEDETWVQGTFPGMGNPDKTATSDERHEGYLAAASLARGLKVLNEFFETIERSVILDGAPKLRDPGKLASNARRVALCLDGLASRLREEV